MMCKVVNGFIKTLLGTGMNNYELMFYWIGITSSGFFILLGMSIFSGYVMDLIWRKFKDGKDLMDIIGIYKQSKKGKENDIS